MPRSTPERRRRATGAVASLAVKRLKMKDLERATGVGREAIRYYIREGLLPEPERPERNVAWYDAAFVERILLIKRLQSERFLPLSVIKGIVGDGRELSERETRALNALDGHLVPASERAVPHAPETLSRLAKRIGLPLADLRELAAAGAVEIVVRDGKQCLEGSSVAIAESWAGIRAAGFDEKLGFGAQDAALYVEVVQWLAREELRRFGGRVAATVDAETARRMAHDGIERINELLGRLREAVLLRMIATGVPAGSEAEQAS